jgi:CheY-like chemotaxis protein
LDDDHSILESVRHFLEFNGASIFPFDHGPSAIAWLEEQSNRCDAVMTDIRMPVMNGFLFVRQIRETLGLLHLPVFAITGEDLHEHSPEFVSAGFTGLIRKPFDPDTLLEKICSHAF